MKNKIIISFFIALNMVYAECYELNQSDCLYWSQYCEWNYETDHCQEIGGGGGGGGDGSGDGPYQYGTVTESQGLRNGPDYRDGVLGFIQSINYSFSAPWETMIGDGHRVPRFITANISYKTIYKTIN